MRTAIRGSIWYDLGESKEMTIILQAHARAAIIDEFKDWASKHPRDYVLTEVEGLLFFKYLESHRPELLTFRYPGHEKWPFVKSWLIEAELISPL